VELGDTGRADVREQTEALETVELCAHEEDRRISRASQQGLFTTDSNTLKQFKMKMLQKQQQDSSTLATLSCLLFHKNRVV